MTVRETPETLVLPVRSIADLLGVVPYLLRHTPTDSLVTVGLHGPEVVLLGRADLPEAGAAISDLHACLYATAPIVARHSRDAVLIGYGPADRVAPVLAEADEVYAGSGVRLLDLLRVTDNRYFSSRCHDPGCCPPQGTPFDASSSIPAAYATAAGVTALPDRTALAATIAAVQGPARDRMRHATRQARQQLTDLVAAATSHRDPQPASGTDRRDTTVPEPVTTLKATGFRAGQVAVQQAFDRYRHDSQPLADDEAAWLILLLAYPPVRDHAFAHTTGTDPDIGLWTDLTRRAEPGLVRAPASLLAFAAWRAGAGTLARLALDRVLADDPTYPLARLLTGLLDSGIAPHEWPHPVTDHDSRSRSGGGGGDWPLPAET